jgi:RNA recognition motif-containing protein
MERSLLSKDSTCRLFVGNMSPQISESDLKTLVGRFGTVTNVYLVKVATTGQSRGFAFVEMNDQRAATRAIQELNGTEIGGRNLKVRLGF